MKRFTAKSYYHTKCEVVILIITIYKYNQRLCTSCFQIYLSVTMCLLVVSVGGLRTYKLNLKALNPPTEGVLPQPPLLDCGRVAAS
jgi:hypothetical protein